MPISRCPNCSQRFAYNFYDEDYSHSCNSGDAAVDQEDFLKIDSASWNLLGLAKRQKGEETNVSGVSDVERRNARNNKSALYSQRQHYEFIKLKGD